MSVEQYQVDAAEAKIVIDLMREEDVGAAQLYPAFERLVEAKVIHRAPGGKVLDEAYR